MYYNDEFPWGKCPFSTRPVSGYAAIDDYYDDDEEYDPDDYPDDDNLPPAIAITPRPSDDVDDLPF